MVDQPELIIHDYIAMFVIGMDEEEKLKRDLANTNYLNIRDRKSKRANYHV